MRMGNLITADERAKENPPSAREALGGFIPNGGTTSFTSYAFDAVVAAGAGIVGAPDVPPPIPP